MPNQLTVDDVKAAWIAARNRRGFNDDVRTELWNAGDALLAALDAAKERARVAEERSDFVRDTLIRLMEENGGSSCREARIRLSGSEIAMWLVNFGSLSKYTSEIASLRAQIAKAAPLLDAGYAYRRARLRFLAKGLSLEEFDMRLVRRSEAKDALLAAALELPDQGDG